MFYEHADNIKLSQASSNKIVLNPENSLVKLLLKQLVYKTQNKPTNLTETYTYVFFNTYEFPIHIAELSFIIMMRF